MFHETHKALMREGSVFIILLTYNKVSLMSIFSSSSISARSWNLIRIFLREIVEFFVVD